MEEINMEQIIEQESLEMKDMEEDIRLGQEGMDTEGGAYFRSGEALKAGSYVSDLQKNEEHDEGGESGQSTGG